MSLGYIDENGVYRRGEAKRMGEDRNTMFRGWSHDQQRAEFAKEVIQPRIGGKPNKAFIEAYPDYSHKYFDQETIDKTLRETP